MKIVEEKSQYHRFALYYDYSQDRVDFCKTLKDSFGWQRFSYDSSSGLKRWVFTDSLFVPVIQQRFPEVEITRQVEDIVSKEQQWSNAQKKNEAKVDEVKLKKDTTFTVKGLKKEMYPYQKVGTEFLVASGGRAIIADAPGLGKTIQALAFAKHMGYGRTLVVAPASVKFAWKQEVKKWTNLTCVVIDSKTDLSKIPSDVEVWIINYDILKKHYEQLAKIRFDCLIGDECQLIKTPTAMRTKAFRTISRHIPSVVLLSGTPLLSRPAELFSLLNIIDQNTWGNWYDYARRYCAAYQSRFGLDTSGASNIEELHARIKRYFIRRDKTEVLKELPPKTFIDMPVELDKVHQEQYTVAAQSLATYLRKFSGKQPAEIAKSLAAEKLTRLNVLRRLNAMGKVETAIDLIESIVQAGEKVLIFSSFIDPLMKIEEHFKGKSVMITGKTDVNDRQYIVEEFQTNKNVQVFLGGIKSAGVGITLTAASNVIFLDYSWNPADHQQAQDRVHRPGQTAKNVNIYQLFAMDTIDEDLKEMLATKQGIFDQVIDGKEGAKVASDAMGAAVKRILKDN
jgi:SWI/SNF-related matrix-associated actin-dependent regulator 1 of chromatin subfamily A